MCAGVLTARRVALLPTVCWCAQGPHSCYESAVCSRCGGPVSTDVPPDERLLRSFGTVGSMGLVPVRFSRAVVGGRASVALAGQSEGRARSPRAGGGRPRLWPELVLQRLEFEKSWCHGYHLSVAEPNRCP